MPDTSRRPMVKARGVGAFVSEPGRGRCRRRSCRWRSAPASAVGAGDVAWWRVAAGPRREPRPPGRRELRQRLQRRDPRHRRRPGRARAARGLRAGPAGRRQAGRLRRLRCRRGRRPRRSPRRPRGGCSPSVRRASSRAWCYTGGPRPYGYAGFGELFVFVFFGLVATVGTTYVRSSASPGPERRDGRRRRLSWPARCSSSTTCATSPSDTAAGKRTLAVRIGDARDAHALRRLARAGVRAASPSPRRVAAVGAPGARRGPLARRAAARLVGAGRGRATGADRRPRRHRSAAAATARWRASARASVG